MISIYSTLNTVEVLQSKSTKIKKVRTKQRQNKLESIIIDHTVLLFHNMISRKDDMHYAFLFYCKLQLSKFFHLA